MAKSILERLKTLENNFRSLYCKVNFLIPKYKVFTALLTQNGGDGPNDTTQGDTIVLGVTYYINANSENADLTVFGAPNSNVGTYFICTQAGILPVIGTISLLANTGAPTVTVLENTIGNIWFEYVSVGVYSVNSSNLFIENKTTIDIDNFGRNASNMDNGPFYIGNETIINAEAQFYIFTSRVPDYRNDVLQKNRIEIRVYN